jgi:hypothetical protein
MPLVIALAAASGPLWAQSELTGIWHIDKPVAALHTANGGEPPLRAEAANRYRTHIAERRHADTSFDSATWCASVGMPRIMTINSPFEIVVRISTALSPEAMNNPARWGCQSVAGKAIHWSSRLRI